jgi:hypothetical protein
MSGLDIYRQYLAFKQHFSNPNFDFFQYEGKVKAKESTYQQRNDFYFFETLARKLNDQQVKEYMLASFVCADDTSKVWIGDIKTNGKENWLAWQKIHGSLEYLFRNDAERVLSLSDDFNAIFSTKNGHPPLLKAFIRKELSLESLLILDIVLGFVLQWDREMSDPLWSSISFKIKKYKPFLSIDKHKYTQILKSLI